MDSRNYFGKVGKYDNILRIPRNKDISLSKKNISFLEKLKEFVDQIVFA